MSAPVDGLASKNPIVVLARSLLGIWTWLVGLVGLMLGSAGAVLTMPFLSHEQRHQLFLRRAMGWNVYITFSSVKIVYDPGFDPKRTSVFMQNHVSWIDGQLACIAIPHAFCGLFNYWHYRVPGYGWIMWLARGIRVFPRSQGRTAEITAQAKDRVAMGISILAFPEGHRTRDGKIGPHKRGTYFMARDAGLPVVPLCVRGLYGVNRKGTWQFWPGRIVVYVGAQMETAGLNDEQIGELADRMRAVHVDFCDRGILPESGKHLLPAEMLAS